MGDNYPSADCEKVYQDFEKMSRLGYLAGPFDEDDPDILVVSSLSAVPKKDATPANPKLRIVVDMSASGLNSNMTAPRFVLPSVEDIADQAYESCYFLVTDLSDGFYMSKIHPSSQPYLGVRHPQTGKLYAYCRAVMGLAVSPHQFSRKVATMVQRAMEELEEFKIHEYKVNDTDPHMPRVYGVDAKGRPVASLKYYVDDGVITGPTEGSVRRAYARLLWFLESRLGMRVNRSKTVGLAHRVPLLGLELDSVGADVGGACTRLPEKRRDKCKRAVKEFMESESLGGKVNRRALAEVTGQLMFASRAISAGRTFLSRLYDCMSEKEEERRGPYSDYDRYVRMTGGARADLRWWKKCLDHASCVSKWKTRTFALQRVWTDASSHGYCDTMEVPATDQLPAMTFGYGVWNKEQAAYSSNWHELACVVMSLAQRLEEVRGSVVHYLTDNATTEAAVNKGVVNSWQLMLLVRDLRLLQAYGDVEVEAFHTKGKIIVAQGTDGGSRQMPHLNQLGSDPVAHDTFDPTAWPAFRLSGEMEWWAGQYKQRPGAVVMSDVADWARVNPAGQDTYWHLRPRHVAKVLALLLDAQLREPATTAFTVVAPWVNNRKWRKYLKHFRRKRTVKVAVKGLGNVAHLVMRYEAGDGLLGKCSRVSKSDWEQELGWVVEE